MLFKNPFLLYGLFFLIVPIIVHLFQLRKFTKIPFTNVAFLKPLITQTRKSRLLKKWLTLLARCAAVACLVFAFAQPFLPSSDISLKEKQTAIYLDNSYSMELNGKNGALYQSATSQLLEKLPADKVFTLFTNDKVYAKTNKQQITNELLSNDYSSTALSVKQIQLKANALLDDKKALKELIIISDFQNREGHKFPENLPNLKRELVLLEPVAIDNIAIDTAFITSQIGDNLKIQIDLSSNYDIEQPVTITLSNKDILVAKTSVVLENNLGTATFDIEIEDFSQGKISIEDKGISFDNELFISSGAKEKIKVLSINGADSDFLDRLYKSEQFDYMTAKEREVNYNLIKNQNLVILNEVVTITESLGKELNNFTNNGGYLVIIPSENHSGYERIKMPGLETNESIQKITEINFNHPIFKNVFNKKISNFQYPNVKTVLKSINATDPILKYEDGSSFLYKTNNTYIFTSSLRLENSNFQNSPLIVPIFYNMAVNALPFTQLYYELEENNIIAVNTTVNQDEILNLSNNSLQLIPRQQAFENYVLITAGEDFNQPGNYQVNGKKENLTTISFNAKRKENRLTYYTKEDLGGKVSTSIDEVLNKLSQEEQVFSLWKYFVMGALFFLICELLILKFVK
jgi:hypothetical protein